MKIRNPRTGLNDYTLQVDNEQKIAEYASELRKNAPQWRSKDILARVEVLKEWVEKLNLLSPQISKALALDTGRNKIAQIELEATKGLIQGWCYKAPQLYKPPENRPSVNDPAVLVGQQWVPYEMTGVISPWNFPLLLALIDTVPALLAGSTVLLKASEVTPRFLDSLEESIEQTAELHKYLKLVRGGAEAGKAVVNEADVICFTGSVETGKKIAYRCTERFVPVYLELGGKDPAIVSADADLNKSTDAILRSCAGATGQACQSLERIYVHRDIHDAFVDLISEKAQAVHLTAEDIHKGQIGPLIFEKQANKIQDHIDDALAKGAILKTGGKVEEINGGLYCRPTVIVNVNHSMKIMTEETFGPLIPIMKIDSDEEGIRLSNDSRYGLSASVFSKNVTHARRIAEQINAGGISINDGSLTNKIFDAEKNSFNQSGLYGSRMGDDGFKRFFRKKAFLIQTGDPEDMAHFEEENDQQ